MKYIQQHIATRTAQRSSRQFLPENALERIPVLGKLLDALVQLVERHRVLEERPAELGLVVDEGDFRDRVGFCGWRRKTGLVTI